MTVVTLGEYNVLFRNKQNVVKNDVLALMAVTSLLGLNEGAKGEPQRGILAACKAAGWKHAYSGESDWILWDPRKFQAVGKPGTAKICRSAKEIGWDIKLHPARMMIWQRLMHFDTGKLWFPHVTHLPQGYAKPEGSFSDKLEWLVDIQAKESVLRVHQICSRHIENTKDAIHHLMGDMNVRQANHQQPWYPSNLWSDDWIPDTIPGSIDWMMHSKRAKANGLSVVKRDQVRIVDLPGHDEEKLNSDHPAGIKKVSVKVA